MTERANDSDLNTEKSIYLTLPRFLAPNPLNTASSSEPSSASTSAAARFFMAARTVSRRNNCVPAVERKVYTIPAASRSTPSPSSPAAEDAVLTA